jgi:hypothetical protein
MSIDEISSSIKIFEVLYHKLTARVLINGMLTENFNIERSVKQGDALSCVLFKMCMETMINKIERQHDIANIRLNEVVIPKVIAYAEDLALLTSNTESIVKCISVKQICVRYVRMFKANITFSITALMPSVLT